MRQSDNSRYRFSWKSDKKKGYKENKQKTDTKNEAKMIKSNIFTREMPKNDTDKIISHFLCTNIIFADCSVFLC